MQTRVAEMLGMEFPVGSFGPSRDAVLAACSKSRPASARSSAGIRTPVVAALQCSVIGDRELGSGQSVAQCNSRAWDQITYIRVLLGEAVDR
jgi:hypothetical protein